jgi:hypothetical protein
MKGDTRNRKGSPKVGNIRRAEHRRNRYQVRLRQRARDGDEKAARMLDQPRTKAGKNRGHARGR